MSGLDRGRMDRRIKLLRAETNENSLGEAVPTQWGELATVWASVRPAPGRERFASAEVAAEALTIFGIGYSSKVAGLNPKDRIEYPLGSGKNYDILAVVEIGRRDGLEITASHRGD